VDRRKHLASAQEEHGRHGARADIAEALELLHQSVEDLRDDLRGQLGEMRELSGRIDFAERLLTKAREDGRV
jgi:hypothetical protein